MSATVDPQVAVIFGASGDLTSRKLLPAFFHLFIEGLLPKGFAVVGYARTRMTDDQFREHAARAITDHARTHCQGREWPEFARRLSYVSGEFGTEGAMDVLRVHLADVDERFGTEGRRLFYCATPPKAYPSIVERLGESGMSRGARIVVEKPFGRDLQTARDLNECLSAVFEESQIFRIDHYLGKETVQNITAFRFANGMFEPIWNRRYIDHVQITVAEDIGVEGRGSFHEATGTVRDMIQTHLLQVLTFVAMEPPVSFEPDRLRDEKVRVLRSMRPVDPSSIVRGQYRGYREEPDVATGSQVETFGAVRVEVDNWRWAGVPFFMRTGKKLSRKVTEVSLAFRNVPYNVFRGTDAGPTDRDVLTIRIQPDEGISLHLNVKRPGIETELDRAVLEFDYGEAFATRLVESYERLILEAMEGDHTLFIREDEVERAWEVLMPVLDAPDGAFPYEPGSWGPQEADELIAPRRWYVGAAGDRGADV